MSDDSLLFADISATPVNATRDAADFTEILRENAPATATLVCGLVDVAAAIERVAAILAPSGASASDDVAATERIDDFAGKGAISTVVAHNVGAMCVLRAASQLRDLAQDVNELIAFAAATAGHGAASANRVLGDETQDDRAGRQEDRRCDSASPLLPEMQAMPLAKEDGGAVGDFLRRFEPPVPGQLSATERKEPVQIIDLDGAAASEISAIESFAPARSLSSSMETKLEGKEPESPAPSPACPGRNSQTQALPSAEPDNSLACVLALSAEELIALFS